MEVFPGFQTVKKEICLDFQVMVKTALSLDHNQSKFILQKLVFLRQKPMTRKLNRKPRLLKNAKCNKPFKMQKK
ncbi:unnamed protein product, partial [Larinioides sclopetarius]